MSRTKTQSIRTSRHKIELIGKWSAIIEQRIEINEPTNSTGITYRELRHRLISVNYDDEQIALGWPQVTELAAHLDCFLRSSLSQKSKYRIGSVNLRVRQLDSGLPVVEGSNFAGERVFRLDKPKATSLRQMLTRLLSGCVWPDLGEIHDHADDMPW